MRQKWNEMKLDGMREIRRKNNYIWLWTELRDRTQAERKEEEEEKKRMIIDSTVPRENRQENIGEMYWTEI